MSIKTMTACAVVQKFLRNEYIVQRAEASDMFHWHIACLNRETAIE